MVIHAWCVMPSHLHLILSCNKDFSLSSLVRDFKKFTSVEITRRLSQIDSKSKYLKVFQISGKKSTKHQKYQVWKEGYHPVELNSNLMLDQRLDYLHDNPVLVGFVDTPEDYPYSSAADYYLNKFVVEYQSIHDDIDIDLALCR